MGAFRPPRFALDQVPTPADRIGFARTEFGRTGSERMEACRTEAWTEAPVDRTRVLALEPMDGDDAFECALGVRVRGVRLPGQSHTPWWDADWLFLKRPRSADGAGEGLDRFRTEVAVACSVRHRNLLHGEVLWTDDGEPWLGFEGADALSLEEVLRILEGAEERFPPHLVGHVVAELAAGVDVLHRGADGLGRARTLCHGAIGAEHVWIDGMGIVRLSGFGSAVAPQEPSREGAKERSYEIERDLRALGAVLQRLLGGVDPLDTRASLRAELVAVARRAGAIGASFGASSHASPDASPSEGFETASEMRGALLNALRNHGPIPVADDVVAFLEQRFGALLSLRAAHRKALLASRLDTTSVPTPAASLVVPARRAGAGVEARRPLGKSDESGARVCLATGDDDDPWSRVTARYSSLEDVLVTARLADVPSVASDLPPVAAAVPTHHHAEGAEGQARASVRDEEPAREARATAESAIGASAPATGASTPDGDRTAASAPATGGTAREATTTGAPATGVRRPAFLVALLTAATVGALLGVPSTRVCLRGWAAEGARMTRGALAVLRPALSQGRPALPVDSAPPSLDTAGSER